MGKKDIQQGDDEYQGCCRKCIAILECCRLAPGTGVKIVSIVSILLGLAFCCLGVWMIIVTSKNNELPLKNQVVYEVSEGPSGKSVSSTNVNGQPALSVRNTVISAGNYETISTQSSLFDTLSVDMSGPSSASSASSSSSSSSSNLVGGSSSSSSWPLSSVSMGKGASGRKPPTMNHIGPKNLILLTTYHQYLLGLGILSICVGFIRALASIFLLWNSVEKQSKTPGAAWILSNIVGTIGLLVYLGVTLNVTGFINDFPWQPIVVHNDRFSFYLLLTMFRVVCVCDIFLTFYFVGVVFWFVRTLH